ncbi:hypothetical protein [Acinetobacter sp. TUM15064]|uniref:hypothetical protein n=1 Tax=Acinetobacter sp. TUM15064 TaxID=2609134 RepID=UPI00124C5D69|nr:hypothetical protein [Acinetobacter sp. TUM15064]
MVASTDIKFFVHSNNNAPQLQNAFGSMIGVLDACLVNGISLRIVSTLTAVGTTVTAVFSASHNLMQYQVIKIVGANQAEYNGEHRILTVPNATSVTFQVASAPSVTTATGSITASLPPLGWEKPFSSTNEAGGGKAAYRSKNTLLPSRPYLRVVDELDPAYTATYAKFAKVGIVENMTGIDTLSGVQAPYDSANVDKNWVGSGSGSAVVNGWARWYYANAAEYGVATSTDATAPASGNRSYLVVGSSDYFYILPVATPSGQYALTYGFGAFESFLAADNACTFLSATLNNNTASSTSNKQGYTGIAGNNSNQLVLLQRAYNQAASYATSQSISLGVSNTIYSGTSDYIGSASLMGLVPISPVFINETVLRGELPGCCWVFQNKPYSNYAIFEKSGDLFIAPLIAASASGSGGYGQIALRIGRLL